MANDRSYIDLTGKVAIVTGGGNGIGRGVAGRLAHAGATVGVADIDVAAATSVRDELRAAGATAEAFEVDVADQASTDSMIANAISALGRVDILVNNAGVGGAPGWTERSAGNAEDWNRVFEVNVLGIVHATQSVSQHMIDRGRKILTRSLDSTFLHGVTRPASDANGIKDA